MRRRGASCATGSTGWSAQPERIGARGDAAGILYPHPMAIRRDFTFHGNGRELTAFYAEPEPPAGADPGAPLPPHPAVIVVH